jgi:hypothetical protein
MNAGQKATKKAAKAGVAAGERSTSVPAFLQYALADGRRAVSELTIAARAAGLLGERQTITTAKSFRAAKKTLGIYSLRDGFGATGEWFWSLPDQTLSAAPSLVPGGHVSERQKSSRVIYVEGLSTLSDLPPLRAPTDSVVGDVEVHTKADASVPSSWKDGIGGLDYCHAPNRILLIRWRQFIHDCRGFLASPENWASRAARLGWDCASLFSYSDSGTGGLLWSLAGGKLVELHRDWAVVESSAGKRCVVDRHRATSAKMTLPWQLR